MFPTMLKHYAGPAIFTILTLLSLSSCEDEISSVGSSISYGDVAISVDSSFLKFPSSFVVAENIDSRSTTNLLGKINVKEFGTLSASYITQMLAVGQLNIPDSIGVDRVDSIKLILIADRKNVIGDSLAPQQFKAFTLDKSLPSGITSNFNPEGYYNPTAPVAVRNYTLSGIALTDSDFNKSKELVFSAPLPKKWGVDLFKAYRTDPSVFAWPETLNKVFPGLYIQHSFGSGAMANISSTSLRLYYHHFVTRNVVENEVSVSKRVTIKDSVTLLTTAPEVLSSTNFQFTPSQSLIDKINSGKKILTAPLGYRVNFTFPAVDILKEYWTSDINLRVINNLTLAFPATTIENDYGISPPPNLLMILSKNVKEFFENAQVPDNKTSFIGTYNSKSGRYNFTSMREFIVNLKNNSGNIEPTDLEFSLIPVEVTSENVTNNYTGVTTTYVTGCTPYIQTPSMVELDLDKVVVVFTFTSQLMK